MKHFLSLLLLVPGIILSTEARSHCAAPTADGQVYEYFISEAMHAPTLSSSVLVVIPGMLNPSVPAGAGHIPKPVDGLEVYPSPVRPILYLKLQAARSGRLQCKLFDADGSLVLQQDTVVGGGGTLQQEAVNTLANGEYTLLVHWLEGADTRISAFRILKVK